MRMEFAIMPSAPPETNTTGGWTWVATRCTIKRKQQPDAGAPSVAKKKETHAIRQCANPKKNHHEGPISNGISCCIVASWDMTGQLLSKWRLSFETASKMHQRNMSQPYGFANMRVRRTSISKLSPIPAPFLACKIFENEAQQGPLFKEQHVPKSNTHAVLTANAKASKNFKK